MHLVDTAPMGVTEINERGVVHDGVEYPLDVLIYATGFQWMATSTFNMIVGPRRAHAEREVADRGHQDVPRPAQPRASRTCSSSPGPQGGGGSFNFTDAIDTHADYVVWMLTTMRERGVDDRRRRRKEPEDAYAEHCREADIATAPLRDCLSYYNGHGDAAPGSLAYYGGSGWNHRCQQARDTLEPYVFDSGVRDAREQRLQGVEKDR